MCGYNSAEISKCSPEEKIRGLECKDYLSNLILGKEIICHFLDKGQGTLIPLKNRDPYGREIVDIWLNEKYVNKIMIEKGYGKDYNGTGKRIIKYISIKD